MKYKIWAAVSAGPGATEELEEIIELDDGLNDIAVEECTNEILWELLYSLGVETAIEKIED